MKLANIIYENELINHNKLSYINYYNQPIEYDSLDKSLPTLYVGWSFMKKCNPDNSVIQNASVLYKKIVGNELYWECSFEESKSSHVNGVEDFIEHVAQYYFSPKYNYINLDPVFFQIVDIGDLMDILPKKFEVMYNYKNELLYVLSDNNIWNINLNLYRFFKFDIDRIIVTLDLRAETSYSDIEGEMYKKYYKLLPNFIRLKRYVIVMLSK